MTSIRPIVGGERVHILDAISHPKADSRPGTPVDALISAEEPTVTHSSGMTQPMPKRIDPLLNALDDLDLP